MRVKQIGGTLPRSGRLTPLLKRLQSLGFVRRERDVADERQVTISLTKAGQELEQRAASIPDDLAAMAQRDQPEGDALIARMSRLRNNLQIASGDARATA